MDKHEHHRFAIFALAVLLSCVYPLALRADEAPRPGLDRTHAGETVPDVPFVDGNGDTHRLSDFRGHILLVTFWATWCHGCVVELPALARLQADDRAHVLIVPINHDKGGSRTAEAYFAKHGLAGLHAFAETSTTHPLATAFGQQWLPTSIVVDVEGKEVARAVGAVDWDNPSIRAIFRL